MTMRRHFGALLAVAVLSPLLGCGKGAPPDASTALPPVGDTPSRKETAPSSKLWHDEDATNAVKVLGYSEAYVFRWQGNVPEGWVEFNGEGGPQRRQLDWCRTMARQFMDQEGGGIPATERFSGSIVIALQKRGKGEGADYDCSVGLCITDKHGETVSTLRLGPIQGQVTLKRLQPIKLWEASSTSFRLNKDDDGKQVTWLEMRLVEPGK
jgi:hypothetical protein